MSYVILVPLLPLLAAIVIGIAGSVLRERSVRIAAPAVIAAFAGAVATLVLVTLNGPISVRFYEPSTAGISVLSLGFYIDRLSAVMMVLITGVSTTIYLYSMRYMQQERGYARFHALLALTTFVLLCMVSSANLLMLFIFWQLLSWLLYLLSYHYSHPPTIEGAFKTFAVLRLGDVAFLAGIGLASRLYGTLDFQPLLTRAADVPRTFSLWPGIGLDISAVTAITLLIFIGAMSKSAQFPMHVWLPASLYAPTPVHALLHAGIINAGGFLINRLAPLYGLAPDTLHVAFVIGGLTAIIAAAIMLTQSDIKTMLGFSTIGQMGYMIMECGLGAFALAIFHLLAHGLFKATVFLNCGNVIHKARQEPLLPSTRPAADEVEFSRLTWTTGFFTILLMPLIILLAAHGALQIHMLDSQGSVIFLFFIWVTSTQAILTLTRLRGVASWKVSGAMLLILLLVVFTYLFAAERFTEFLYPDRGEVAAYFKAAALPGPLFDVIVLMRTLLIVLGWFYLYARTRGERMPIPPWVETIRASLYLLFMNRLYLDVAYSKLGASVMRQAYRFDRSWLGRML